MARYNLFDKDRADPFPISRSGIDQFIRDPRSFVLQRKYGVKPPKKNEGDSMNDSDLVKPTKRAKKKQSPVKRSLK